MPQSHYRTAPIASTQMPGGIPYIIGNEAAERFSFYGMKAVLVVFMTQYLMASDGELDVMNEADAVGYFHLFSSGVYFTPLLGALLSDIFLGKYRTIISLSVVYCLGHLALALDDTRVGLTIGLSLIAIGSGGIKPCVSAHVGDQFGRTNGHLLSRVFSYFYFAINLGAFASMLLTPILLDRFGPHAAFGVPGALMLLATLVFWAGRHEFIHIPPGGHSFSDQLFSKEGFGALLRLGSIFLFAGMFWSLFDQTGSSWVLQANDLDRNVFGIELLSSQIQASNPVLIMAFIPLFSFVIYPSVARFTRVTPLRKISVGFFLTVLSYLVLAQIEVWIAAGQVPSIAWQVLAFVIITAAEVLISITLLEFSYTQAPPALKSMVMSLNLMSVSLGNFFTSGVNFFIRDENGQPLLEGADYFLFFAAAMFVTAVLFAPVVARYRERIYLHDEAAD
ncbi:MAG: POT family MFS transporter [Deltaproteobacteria bacterium]|nr:POT family MFS transporter [Deltaproteobacteria bacterium]MBW2382866.1 POT family MFS transporter [Deltaproteobacteria bacterium]MBW2697867.1 POT family MFS transporter [Deltaproteobacteria bacterium]